MMDPLDLGMRVVALLETGLKDRDLQAGHAAGLDRPLTGHLFGQDRVGLGKLREAYFDEFGASCFYCAQALHASSPIDHVLPWSHVRFDGLANLVPACGKCNLPKSGALPAPHHVSRSLARDPAVLASICSRISWLVQRERTVSAARGLSAASPAGTPLWDSRGRFANLDLTVVNAPWMSVEYRH